MKQAFALKTLAVTASTLAMTGLLAAETAFAQTDEIIVTARKQAQNLQDVPLAITALGEVEIESAGYEDIIDLSKAAPGLFIESINSLNARIDTSPRFRGVTFDSTSPLQRTATVFIDGILTSGGIQSLGLKEVERVEIIKGPQSALFGRNTFSGAINYITKDPSNEFGASLSALAATRGEYRIDASLEGPILGDSLTGRINGGYVRDEGHYTNTVDPSQELGTETGWNIAGTLAFNPSENFRARLRGNYYQNDDGPAAVIRVAGFAEHNFGGFPLAGGGTTETAFRGTIRTPDESEIGLTTDQATFDRTTQAALNDAFGRTPQFIDLDFDDLGGAGLVNEGYRLSFDATYDFDGGVSLDVLAGYNEDEYLLYQDFDSTAGFGFNSTVGQQVQDLSLEARLSGSAFNDRLDWSFGGNYLDIDVESVGGFYDGVLDFWFGGIFNDRFFTAAQTFGIFGTLDYKVSDQFTIILEGRYQEDEISNEGVGPISPATFTRFLPRVLLQYEPSDDTTLYANYSVGNLPGGFNQEVGELDAGQLAEFNQLNPGVTTTFDEEKLENYELGWKQTLFDGAAAFNLAAFYMRRSDQIFSGFQIVSDVTQVNGVRTVAFTDNGATTNITGIELDGTIRASEHLTLQGSLSYVDAEIDSFPAGSNAGDFTAVFGPGASVQGQRAPRFPSWAGSLSGTYERPISGDLFGGGDTSWYTRGDVFYTGEFFDENTNLAETPAAVDVNLRTGIRRDNVSVEVFVTNLFDEDAPAAANNIADTSLDVRFGSGFFDFSQESVHVALRDRRQFGVRLNVDF